MAKRKKIKGFTKFIIIWALVLLIAGEILLIYVYNVMIDYEKGNVDVFVNSLVKDIKSSGEKGNIDKYFKLEDVSSEYEKKSSLKKGYQELFKNASEVTAEKCMVCEIKNVYLLKVDNKEIAKIYLDDSETKEALLILNYKKWKVDKIQTTSKGIYDIDIYIPKDYTLMINDKKVANDKAIELSTEKGYEEVSTLENVPALRHFKISDLTKKPSVKVLDSNNKEVSYKNENGKYYVSSYYETNDEKEAMAKLKNEFDVLSFAELWSKYLSRDLTGTRYGYNTVSSYLINNTELYQRAYDWAHNVDITFVSAHNLLNPAFTNEKLSNFKIYNPYAFSVDVYLEKNMVLTRTNSKRVDVMNDTLYIIYDNGYKIAKMVSKAE